MRIAVATMWSPDFFRTEKRNVEESCFPHVSVFIRIVLSFRHWRREFELQMMLLAVLYWFPQLVSQ